MATTIMTFYNEEYLLPWWIKHHSKIFEHGILVDYHSTDRSYEICKDLCPKHWKIFKSFQNDFSSDGIDGNMQFYEKSVNGFKMPLTTAEFLLTPAPLDALDNFCLAQNIDFLKAWGVCMVDTNTTDLPTYDKHLYEQKHHGMINGYVGPKYNPIPDYCAAFYSRTYHNKPMANYAPGRHFIWPPGPDQSYNIFSALDVFTLKYRFSPWNETTIKRIQQFKSRVPQYDLDSNKGGTHCLSEEQYIEEYDHYLTTAYDLKTNEQFLNAYNYCVSL